MNFTTNMESKAIVLIAETGSSPEEMLAQAKQEAEEWGLVAASQVFWGKTPDGEPVVTVAKDWKDALLVLRRYAE
jgi:nucleotide-binding universal stress UspA family protein